MLSGKSCASAGDIIPGHWISRHNKAFSQVQWITLQSHWLGSSNECLQICQFSRDFHNSEQKERDLAFAFRFRSGTNPVHFSWKRLSKMDVWEQLLLAFSFFCLQPPEPFDGRERERMIRERVLFAKQPQMPKTCRLWFYWPTIILKRTCFCYLVPVFWNNLPYFHQLKGMTILFIKSIVGPLGPLALSAPSIWKKDFVFEKST